ncbi:MAG: TolC family protein, partial [Myxococcales bacterium]|nr:TolC family protein [Myxococcales bacterium]
MVDLTPGGPGSQPRVLPLSRLMLAALVILGSAGDVAAQPTSPPDRPDLGTVPEPGTVRLSFEAALDRAGRSAPRLGPRREAMASIAPLQDAADLAITQPPTIQSYGGVRYLADGRARPEVQVAYWHNIPMRGVGSARSKVAAATTRQAEADLQIAQADSRLAAALAWVDARVAREIVDHRRRSLEDAESLAALARDRVEAGADDPSLGAIARAVVGSSRAELLRALGSETEAIMGLAHAIGLSPDQRIEAVGPTELRLVGPREREVLAAADRGHPSLQRTAPDVAMAEAQADLALASNAPNLSFGPSVTREGGGDWVFLAQISV